MRLYFIPVLLAATVACQSTETNVNTTQPDPAGPAPVPVSIPVESSAPALGAPQDGDDAADLVKRRQEAQDSLALEYIAQGRSELDRADMEAALSSASAALNLAPENQDARDLLRQIQGLMGDGYASAYLSFTDEVERMQVRRAQARVEASEHTIKAETAFREGDYNGAIQHYRQAEMVLRYHPLIADNSLDERILRDKIGEAIRLRDEAITSAEEEARMEAERARQDSEERERNRRENKLREYYDLANKAFLAERFDESEGWCDLILVEDPGNEAATSLKRIARESRHYNADEINRRDYREQWLRTFEELDTMNVPQTDALTFNVNRWREVSGREPLSHDMLEPGTVDGRSSILARLEA
ncbi:MAG: hypothetical protein O2816_20230, partial [Planctomycetota bacterium]|nr:hypothetical protein [Planctomycetota bacterium]